MTPATARAVVPSVVEAVRTAAQALEAAGWSPDEARGDAEALARAGLGWDLAAWVVRGREPATSGFTAAFGAAVARRLQREPVAYITGEREFYGRAFRVTRDVLIPRPETELLVDESLAVLRLVRSTRPADVLDVGTGSGCLAITVALEAPNANVRATDLSEPALAVAADNAERLGAGRRVDFVREDLTGDTIAQFDLVVSNPPYIAANDRTGLMPDVVGYEPPLALFGGADGLGVIRSLVPAAGRALRPGGWLVMEIGAGQADGATEILARVPALALVRIARDLASIPRALVARRTD